jgi:hypothetical protein
MIPEASPCSYNKEIEHLVTLRGYNVGRLTSRRETRCGRLNFGRTTPAFTATNTTFCGVYLSPHTSNWNAGKGSTVFSIYATHPQNLALKRALFVGAERGVDLTNKGGGYSTVQAEVHSGDFYNDLRLAETTGIWRSVTDTWPRRAGLLHHTCC